MKETGWVCGEAMESGGMKAGPLMVSRLDNAGLAAGAAAGAVGTFNALGAAGWLAAAAGPEFMAVGFALAAAGLTVGGVAGLGAASLAERGMRAVGLGKGDGAAARMMERRELGARRKGPR